MKPIRPIMEEDLHAFVDRALDSARQAEVQAYLEAHPDVAARVGGYLRQREVLRAALAPVAEEPIPPQLNLRHLAKQKRGSWVAQYRVAAAAVVLLVLGGAGGWSLHALTSAPPAPTGIAALAQEAAYMYGVYSSDQAHPVEFKAVDKARLVDWISSRLQRTISVPDLNTSGYQFMGGRLVATPHGPAGLLMYDNGAGLRLALLVRPMTIDKNTRMTEHSDGTIQAYAWAKKGMGYSLVGTTSAHVLHPLANDVRRQEEGI
jgi:anti-sigma factor RsiW